MSEAELSWTQWAHIFRVPCPTKPWKYSRCQPSRFRNFQLHPSAHILTSAINPVYLNDKKFITPFHQRQNSQTVGYDLLTDYLCCPRRRLKSATCMYSFQRPPNRYAPLTRYHMVSENQSHLYSQGIYIVYNEKRENRKKQREKPRVRKD